MEVVRRFKFELTSMYGDRIPIKKSKIMKITKIAMENDTLCNHFVMSVEKFIHECLPEYKVPGLYVIDCIVKQSQLRFGREHEEYGLRFQRHFRSTFENLLRCPDEDTPKIIEVLDVWRKNRVFPVYILQPLYNIVLSTMVLSRTSDRYVTCGNFHIIFQEEKGNWIMKNCLHGEPNPGKIALSGRLSKAMMNGLVKVEEKPSDPRLRKHLPDCPCVCFSR